MARYRKRASRARSGGRRSAGRYSGGYRSRSAPRKSRGRRRSSGARSQPQTLKIVIEQSNPQGGVPGSLPQALGNTAAVTPGKRARF